MTTAPILRSAHVRRPIDEAFTLFTEQIGAWWPLSTHGVFGDRAGGLDFVDGELVERSCDGQSTTWGEVVAWDPPCRLAMTWHPGRAADDASMVEVSFTADVDGTRVEIRHDGWEAFGEEAAARRRSYVGPNAWGYVLDFYCDLDEASEAVVANQ